MQYFKSVTSIIKEKFQYRGGLLKVNPVCLIKPKTWFSNFSLWVEIIWD